MRGSSYGSRRHNYGFLASKDDETVNGNGVRRSIDGPRKMMQNGEFVQLAVFIFTEK